MLGDAANRTDPHGAHRAGQRLGGRGGRSPLDRRREALHLDQRARRVAPSLRRLARWRQDAAGDAGRVRPPQPRERVRAGRSSSAWTRRPDGSTTRRRPTNATQLYLYRTRLDGKGKQERVTPQDQPGYHLYKISPDGRWAFHSYSRLGTPPAVDLVRLPKHERVRTLVANQRLRDAVARLRRGTGGVRQGGRGRRAPARRLGHEAAGLRLDQAIPACCSYVYGEPAGQTALDQWDGRTISGTSC